MANRLLTLITFLIFQISYCQDINNSYTENYSFLSRIEYDRLLDISAEKFFDGNYYIVDNSKNVSIKRYIKGVKTGE